MDLQLPLALEQGGEGVDEGLEGAAAGSGGAAGGEGGGGGRRDVPVADAALRTPSSSARTRARSLLCPSTTSGKRRKRKVLKKGSLSASRSWLGGLAAGVDAGAAAG
jgi:hypothetical protein